MATSGMHFKIKRVKSKLRPFPVASAGPGVTYDDVICGLKEVSMSLVHSVGLLQCILEFLRK